MKYIICSIVCLLVVNLGKSQTPSRQLDSIVQTYQDHKGYDQKIYPLGLYTKAYYQQEANFASQLLTDLAEMDNSQLSETEQISLEMLKFKLKETVDFYEFEAYLNPLLSDSGFHLSLSYEVRDLTLMSK